MKRQAASDAFRHLSIPRIKQFSNAVDPIAKGFSGSHSKHEFIGNCRDIDKALRDAPLIVRDGVCACSCCRDGRYWDCKLKSEVGTVRRVTAPLEHDVPTRVTRTAALEGWSDSLVSGQIVAVRVDADERNANLGHQRYWLARLRSAAFTLSENTLHAGTQYDAGFVLCKAEWYNLVQESERGYRLLPDEIYLSVNDMVRLTGIDWEKREGVAWALCKVYSE